MRRSVDKKGEAKVEGQDDMAMNVDCASYRCHG